MNFFNSFMKIWTPLYKGWRVFLSWFNRGYKWIKQYKNIYFLIGLLAPRKTYPETDKKHSYGIIICARNERLVIGNLIDSIHAQDYDKDKLKIFVIADNCTDNTAQICRDKGCIVYERFDKEHARKGYAMEFLFDKIAKDYGIENLDGYVVFDADNLLSPNFMTELNKAFDTGAGIVVGYRNTKNFDRNWISSGYGIHFYQSVVTYHRPRAWLNTPTHIAGTGFVVASRLLKNGWHYTCLTEDTQFTMNSVADGEFIAFCEDAEFFDEQPYEIKVMIRQRIRWIRGRWYSFFSTIPKLFSGMFKGPRRAFACYDMFVYCFPGSTYYAFLQIIFPFLRWIVPFILGFFIAKSTAGGSGASDPFYLVIWAGIWGWIVSKAKEYLTSMIKSALIVIRERPRIRCSTPKLVFYTVIAPWFDIIGAPLSVLALFSSSQWKPIKHDEAISIDQLTPAKK